MKRPFIVTTVEWTVSVPGHPEPAAIIRRLKLQGLEHFRVVTWAPTSAGRELVGYFPTGDAAAEAAWRRYCDDAATQHERAAVMHGGQERGGPSSRR